MEIDAYTKIILTVIACSLTIIAVQDVGLIPEAHAFGHDVQKVEIANMLPISVFIEGGEVEVWGTVESY